MTTEERVFERMAVLLFPRHPIVLTDKLVEDLGADSLAFEELAMLVEQEFAFGRITPEEQSSWVTVGDVVKTVEGKLAP